ncbi:glyoxalase family protein [Halalkalibacter wakoensis JCM 9140]|uniref:Glyoxalase family protein n=1 Tax=Halalkalibacter wakoensis JCM 9140 TaxID=1236970 RepID=W4Q6N5_9BACI|nr:VOC family protein [Halalkalibacter wakoensis]GAE27625.1 glyoxalase family protein [Halalkalibacter wakoensis JCM 9140]
MSNFHNKPSTFVSQVNVKVEDLQRSLKFYQEIIGFHVLRETGTSAVLTADGKTPLVNLEQPEHVKKKEPRKTGLYHFALLLPTRKDLGMFINHIVQKRYPIQGGSDHTVSEALYLADPDDNGIEVYVDRPASTWAWEDQFVSMGNKRLDIDGLIAEANNETWTGLPVGTIMGHIHLHVNDLEKAERFYCDGLGFELVMSFHKQAIFLSTGSYHHHIGANVWNGTNATIPSSNSVGLSHYTIVYPSADTRSEAIDRVRKLGYDVMVRNEVVETIDPSGNKIQLLLS